MFYRVEVSVAPGVDDPKAQGFLRQLELARPALRKKVRSAHWVELYWIEASPSMGAVSLEGALNEVFSDPVLNRVCWKDSAKREERNHLSHVKGSWAIERRFRPGVTDNVGRTVLEAMALVLGQSILRAASGALLAIEEASPFTEAEIKDLSESVFCNPLIESWSHLTKETLAQGARFRGTTVAESWPQPRAGDSDEQKVERIGLNGLSDESLVTLSRDRLWALNLAEMRAIRDHFSEAGRDPTDVEIEIIAQTWSEHCKHKIFGADIDYTDQSSDELGREIPTSVQSLFKTTIAATTKELPRPWLLSVFSDNAGIVAIDDETAVCIKVETHNSPSALDPFGGALTGIVGVNRDVLGCGLGAKPLFNTNVFCTAEIDYTDELPDRLKHPRRILDGVRRGVEAGGNQSGIPTVNGALVFDERYLGKPMVYCGTGGVMPRTIAGRPCETKEIESGDRVVMVGGRIGKDGIHGATFSSLALDETAPATAVQLGDPITQKRMSDFLLEARDRGLYRALTDNGAGGLSSSVGELAQITGGATIDVALAPVKYPGLKPYERVISESQERMTMAVPREQIDAFLKFADERGVEATDLGIFDRTGNFHVKHAGRTVAQLSLKFLHEGCPRLKLKAEWKGTPKAAATRAPTGEASKLYREKGEAVFLRLLSRPNIASKEWLIRQYDHEVQGLSVIKPLHQVESQGRRTSGPNDSGVVRVRHDSPVGVAVGCGIWPRLGDHDPYLMAEAAVDESIRNVLASGAEYGDESAVIALVDNFCWPDPVDDVEKAAALVRTCFGMRRAAMELGIPLVSGKDSMKNDYRGKLNGRDVKISVPYTLLMTAIARVVDTRQALSSDFKAAGDLIYRVGPSTLFGLRGSEWERAATAEKLSTGGISSRLPASDWKQARAIYSWFGGKRGAKRSLLKSVHDLSEGGFYTAAMESALARGLGVRLAEEEAMSDRAWEWAFGEGLHSFVVSVSPGDAPALETDWTACGVAFQRVGEVTADGVFTDGVLKVSVEQARAAWKREGYWE